MGRRGRRERKQEGLCFWHEALWVSELTLTERRCTKMVGKREKPTTAILGCDLSSPRRGMLWSPSPAYHFSLHWYLSVAIMLKWTNPTIHAACCPNWWCLPNKIYAFPLIGIHEPMRIHKDPETIVKTRDRLGREVTAMVPSARIVVEEIDNLQIPFGRWTTGLAIGLNVRNTIQKPPRMSLSLRFLQFGNWVGDTAIY